MFIQVIPPGMEFNHIITHEGDIDGDSEGNDDHQAAPDPPIWSEVLLLSCHSHGHTVDFSEIFATLVSLCV